MIGNALIEIRLVEEYPRSRKRSHEHILRLEVAYCLRNLLTRQLFQKTPIERNVKSRIVELRRGIS